MTVKLIFENMDREAVRLVVAALRDKRQQCLDTRDRDPGNPVPGEQAHMLGGLVEQARRVYETYPMPQVHGEFVE